jgi:hypothetical protein
VFKLATCGIFSKDELCDVRDGGGSNREEEERDGRDLESFTNFDEANAIYETVKSFLFRAQHWWARRVKYF